jgi:hypothetical protein
LIDIISLHSGRAELGSGKNATINTTGRTAQEKDKAPAVDSVAAAWQLNGMAGDEAGPSDPRGDYFSHGAHASASVLYPFWMARP